VTSLVAAFEILEVVVTSLASQFEVLYPRAV